MTDPAEAGWQKTGSHEIHAGRVRLVEHDVVLADGTRARYEVDESVPFAVATLVVEGKHVVLSRQYRYPLDRWIYDLPGGAGAEDETPERAARRARGGTRIDRDPNDSTPHVLHQPGPRILARPRLLVRERNDHWHERRLRPGRAGQIGAHDAARIRHRDCQWRDHGSDPDRRTSDSGRQRTAALTQPAGPITTVDSVPSITMRPSAMRTEPAIARIGMSSSAPISCSTS